MIIENTLKKIRAVYPSIDPETVREDLLSILDVIFAVAHGEGSDLDIEKLSIRAYAKHMTAPHRMDLMVSAMTDENGAWKCNQKCRFCYAAGLAKSAARELSTDEWKQVIDKLIAARVPMLTFTGGEPTLRDDITELIRHAGFCVTRLNTNGVLLSKELCEKLKEASLDSVQITLYSHDSKIHNTLVGSEHFDDTVNGIQNAVAAGLDVSVNTPLCKDNADYVKTLAFLHTLGIRFVTVSGLITTGNADKVHTANDLTEAELTAIVQNAKAYCNENGMEIDFTSPGLIAKETLEALGMNVPMCGAALSNMAIAPDGEVIPCQSWLDAGAGLGNIRTLPFKKIWNHKNALRLRNMSEDEALACPFRTNKEGVLK